MRCLCLVLFAGLLLPCTAPAQVYGPFLKREGDVDSTSIAALAQSVTRQAKARTEREKVEAIWRFFLTDGRFVKPGFIYHIAGWAYEEPNGEVLDVTKLLNGYGFGLCYQIAPVLQAAWHALGFKSRVWFLTGHTVAEVFYDGAYHYFDSDMLGYTPLGETGKDRSIVASVRQLEQDPGIILRKLKNAEQVIPGTVDYPWYPADLQAAAMKDLAGLFSSAQDNWLFPYQRYVDAHRLHFAIRPGERMTLWYRPVAQQAYYLPFQFNGQQWTEFPRPVPQHKVLTEDGPRSQKDARLWGTGRLEYEPDLSNRRSYDPRWTSGFNQGIQLPEKGQSLRSAARSTAATAVFAVASPYALFDAEVRLQAKLATRNDAVRVEVTTDEGRTWQAIGSRQGPLSGEWKIKPTPIEKTAHGERHSLTGQYSYLVRLSLLGEAAVQHLKITSDFQLNPRSLPQLQAGDNTLHFQAQPSVHHQELPFEANRFQEFSYASSNLAYLAEGGNGLLVPATVDKPAEMLVELSSPMGDLLSFAAGARFLQIDKGTAPDKFTAEVRKTAWQAGTGAPQQASLAWSTSPQGPFVTLWEWNPTLQWHDGDKVDRLLLWPEVDRSVQLPHAAKKVYLRYRVQNMALDSVRYAIDATDSAVPTTLAITHAWKENGQLRQHQQQIPAGTKNSNYQVKTGSTLENEYLIYTGLER